MSKNAPPNKLRIWNVRFSFVYVTLNMGLYKKNCNLQALNWTHFWFKKWEQCISVIYTSFLTLKSVNCCLYTQVKTIIILHTDTLRLRNRTLITRLCTQASSTCMVHKYIAWYRNKAASSKTSRDTHFCTFPNEILLTLSLHPPSLPPLNGKILSDFLRYIINVPACPFPFYVH